MAVNQADIVTQNLRRLEEEGVIARAISGDTFALARLQEAVSAADILPAWAKDLAVQSARLMRDREHCTLVVLLDKRSWRVLMADGIRLQGKLSQ